MIGHETFIKSNSILFELEHSEVAKELKENTNVLAAVYKVTYTNDLDEFMLVTKASIYSNTGELAVDNTIKTSSKWYKTFNEEDCYSNESEALNEALKELYDLCSGFNVETKDILTQLMGKRC